MRSIVAAILPLVIGASAVAYNPPSDTAGPLTVQMQPPAVGAYGAGGYADLGRAGVPFVVPVTLQNAGDREITGTLRMMVIDGWQVAPAGALPFQIRPHGRLRREFTLTFPTATHNAHYPIHVYAEFEWGAQKLTAHPVMMVQPQIPDLPRPKLPVAWNPVPIPKGGTLGLWRMPVRRETVEIANTGADAGASGREVFEAGSVILYGALGNGGTREGIGMSLGPRLPSRRETVEAAAVEFPLALPAVTPLRLEFEMAGAGSFEVKSAPAAGGAFTTVFHGKSQGSSAQPVRVDLARYAGSSIRLRLEAREGTGEAQWGEPTIVAGHAPQAPAFPPSGQNSRLLGAADGCEVRLWPGSRGLLDAPVGLLCGARRLFFQGLRVRVAGDALEEWRASSELLDTREEPAGGHVRLRHRFRNWAGAFDVMGEMWVERDALCVRVWLENAPAPQPWFQVYLEAVSAGAWSETAARVYGGPGNVIQKPRAFRLGFDGHNLASSFVGFDFENGMSLVQNSDAIPDRLEVDPEKRIYSLVTPHPQTLQFFPARNVFAGVKRIREQDTRQPSKGVAKLAGRFTFDLWSGRYADQRAGPGASGRVWNQGRAGRLA
jgi:hypothetical protein